MPGKTAYTVRAILDRAGIGPDATLIVHSGFRRLGAAGHRAEEFAERLLESLPRGTLLMPAMTWRTVTPENPVFDELTTPSHTGILAEIFRARFATARSLHPTHSTAAAGLDAAAIVAGHERGTTPCPPESPFGRLTDTDAQILLLGCDMERCTAIHCAEEQYAPDLYLRPLDETVVYSCRDRNGSVHAVRTRRHWRLERNFNQFVAPLRERGRLVEGEVDGTPWLCFGARALRDVLDEAFRVTPEATISPSARTGATYPQL
jgi:aminoglycoside 3-N-acetyltransferase